MSVLHGWIQKARIDARELPYKIHRSERGFVVWLRDEDDQWYEAGTLRFKLDVEDFLVGKLTQEDR